MSTHVLSFTPKITLLQPSFLIFWNRNQGCHPSTRMKIQGYIFIPAELSVASEAILHIAAAAVSAPLSCSHQRWAVEVEEERDAVPGWAAVLRFLLCSILLLLDSFQEAWAEDLSLKTERKTRFIMVT